jgi:hypothetical protein
VVRAPILAEKSTLTYDKEVPIVLCGICGKNFYVKPSHQKLGWGKYCSKSCRSKAQFNGSGTKCYICGKNIYRTLAQLKNSASGKYFCSKSCQTKWRNGYFIGEKHANWIDGSSAYRRILKSYKKIPKCSRCGVTDQRILNAHHLDHNRQNNLKSNLVWVCLNCHFLIHHDKNIENEFKIDA